MAAAPPIPRTRPGGGLYLADLRRLADEFDELSGGQLWPAADFIEFVRLELTAGAEGREAVRRERHAESMRRYRARTPARG